jgi:DNA modification methylase
MQIQLKKGKMSHPSGQRNALNDMTGSEWAQSSKSTMQYEDHRSEKQKLHGAAFPQSLAEHHISIYTKKGETVLDPFAGVGTTLDACIATGRNGIGVELNPDFVKMAEQDLATNRSPDLRVGIICDDIANLKKYVKPETIDFVITSPPYANMLAKIQKRFLYKWKTARDRFGFKPIQNTRPYSNNPRDLGNLPYDKCLDALEQVFRDTYDVTKPESYAAWVVKDFRDLKNGQPYVNFHSDLIQRALRENWILWDIRIFDQTVFRPLVVLGIPSRNFYLNIGHSFILMFKKTNKLRTGKKYDQRLSE